VDAEEFERSLTPYSLGPVSMQEVDLMEGHQFAEFIANCFRIFGCQEAVVRKTNDFGGDVMVSWWGGASTAVQVKRYADKVDRKAVSDAFAAKAHYKTSDAMAVTNSYFSKAAREHAIETGVRLG
jgi:Predicted endonuclease distantly related to archaeal Holliday junction resolvase and Mrr-like restriction enzymes